jgi:hypothetical protein
MNKVKMSLFFGLIVLFTACTSDADKRIDAEKLEFNTTDESELYFKNVRQSEYDLAEMENAGINIFRAKSRTAEADYPLLTLAIAHNWRIDKCYLFLEPSESMPKEEFDLIIVDEKTSERKELKYTAEDHIDDKSRVVVDLYTAIQDGKKIFWNNGSSEVEILDKQADRESFRITALDYYKMIGALK